MENSGTDSSTACRPQHKHSISYRLGALIGLQFLTAAAFGIMSPILSIVMAEVSSTFVRYKVQNSNLPTVCMIRR